MEKNTSIPGENPAPSNAFMRVLAEHRNGVSLTELTEAMQQCVESVRETGKPAEIKYTFRLEPSGGEAMLVTDKIETKLPKEKREGAIFFPTSENTLSRKNENQRELELREVTKPDAPLRDVTAPKVMPIAVAKTAAA